MVNIILITIAVMIIAATAEIIHSRRIKKVKKLAFPTTGKLSAFATIAPYIKTLMLGILTFSLLTLLSLEPKAHTTKIKKVEEHERQHLIIVLDVSPSMRLIDSGPDSKQSRLRRTSDALTSTISRISKDLLHLTIIATYTTAKPIVIDTKDIELINGLLDDLPLHYAFKQGETDLFSGIKEAAKIAKDWQPNSTTLVIVSDGETVPNQGMPKLPPSITDTIVAGVGNPTKGTFLNGKNSRQNVATLQNIANRLGGTYHNINKKHIPTETIRNLQSLTTDEKANKFSKRETCLALIALSATILAFLRILTHYSSRPKKKFLRNSKKAPQKPNTTLTEPTL